MLLKFSSPRMEDGDSIGRQIQIFHPMVSNSLTKSRGPHEINLDHKPNLVVIPVLNNKFILENLYRINISFNNQRIMNASIFSESLAWKINISELHPDKLLRR